MKKFAFAAIASVAVLSLSACGKSDSPDVQASEDSADMPADEAVNQVEASAAPVTDNGASSSEAAKEAAKTPDQVKDDAAQVAKEFNDLEEKPAEGAPKPN